MLSQIAPSNLGHYVPKVLQKLRKTSHESKVLEYFSYSSRRPRDFGTYFEAFFRLNASTCISQARQVGHVPLITMRDDNSITIIAKNLHKAGSDIKTSLYYSLHFSRRSRVVLRPTTPGWQTYINHSAAGHEGYLRANLRPPTPFAPSPGSSLMRTRLFSCFRSLPIFDGILYSAL
ncbi:hypothetical protein EAF04_003618 [Stromatinia cepivora]|nr:hypothetical protein EAF04_003618 [Stromatinia cepivora]